MNKSSEDWAYAYFFTLQDSSHSVTEELIVSFDEPNLFEDPFDVLCIKISATIAYSLGMLTSVVLCTFAFYQKKSHADHHKTVINQLVSSTCLMVTFCVFLSKGSRLYNSRVRFAHCMPFGRGDGEVRSFE